MNELNGAAPKSNSMMIGLIVFVALILLGIGFFVYKGQDQAQPNNSNQTTTNNNNDNDNTSATTKAQTTLMLTPADKSVTVGETFSVDVILDTANQPIDAVDIYALHYDSKLLRVVDDVTGQTGVQIMPGQVLTVNGANMVDNSKGEIKFGQAAPGGTNYKGKGVLATIHFKALAAGSSKLTFDFTPGSTIDTNAAHAGKDQLRVATGAMVNVTAK